MQQYFSDIPLAVGQEYIFNKDQAHHAKNVVRLHHEKIRLVYDGIGYFADAYSKGKDFVAMVLEKDERINEIGVEVTLAIGLIRKEKFELVLQKACELGVTRIDSNGTIRVTPSSHAFCNTSSNFSLRISPIASVTSTPISLIRSSFSRTIATKSFPLL